MLCKIEYLKHRLLPANRRVWRFGNANRSLLNCEFVKILAGFLREKLHIDYHHKLHLIRRWKLMFAH